MLGIRCTFSGKDEIIARLSEIERLPKSGLKAALNQWRFALSNEIANSLTNGPVKKRTGALYKSAADRNNLTVIEDGDNLVVKFKKVLISYAYTLERGKTAAGKSVIEAKPGKFLAIPLLGRDSNKGKSDTGGATRLMKSKKGASGFTVMKDRRGESPRPLFLLRKQVNIKHAPWFTTAVERALPSLKKILSSSIAKE